MPALDLRSPQTKDTFDRQKILYHKQYTCPYSVGSNVIVRGDQAALKDLPVRGNKYLLPSRASSKFSRK